MNWEFAILDFIRDNFSCKAMDIIMEAVTFLGEAGWLWILIGLVLSILPKTRKIGFTVLGALIINLLLCNVILKPLVERTRPYDIREIELILSHIPTDFSFPSGHTSASFAAAVAIFIYNKKWGGAAVALAALIGFTRLYLYVHFPTDVLAGAVLGVLCAIISFFIVKLGFRKYYGRRVYDEVV